MSRLICKLHLRRVQIIDATQTLVHASNSRERCASEYVLPGRKGDQYTPAEVMAGAHRKTAWMLALTALRSMEPADEPAPAAVKPKRHRKEAL
jgi:hypothetical protein